MPDCSKRAVRTGILIRWRFTPYQAVAPDYLELGCNWVAVEVGRAPPGSSANDVFRQSVDLDPPIKVVATGHEVMLLTKSDEHDLPTPRWKCRSARIQDVSVIRP